MNVFVVSVLILGLGCLPFSQNKRIKATPTELSALLQEIKDDWLSGLLSGNVSDKKLAQLFDPEDVQYMFSDTQTLTSAQAIIDETRARLAKVPSDLVFRGTPTEATLYKVKGRKYANCICRKTALDGQGNVLFTFRQIQIWRRAGKKWRIHREISNLECIGNCPQDAKDNAE